MGLTLTVRVFTKICMVGVRWVVGFWWWLVSLVVCGR